MIWAAMVMFVAALLAVSYLRWDIVIFCTVIATLCLWIGESIDSKES